MGKNQHVVKAGQKWGVRGANNAKLTGVFNTQNEAIDYARTIAINQHSEMLIHGRDGKIRERNTYGKDPFPPRG